MATYFLDTSAIVKRYVPAEQGHSWVVALCLPLLFAQILASLKPQSLRD